MNASMPPTTSTTSTMSWKSTAALGWWAGRQIARYMPRRYILGGSLWAANHSIPVVAGFVLKMVFDRISDDSPAGLDALSLVGVFVAVEAVRSLVWWAAVVAWPLWWHGVMAMLRANILESLLCDAAPADGRLPGSSGEAVNRLRDDVEDLTWFVDVWVDIVGGVIFTLVAVAVMLTIDPIITIAVALPMAAVVVGTRVFSQRIRASYAASRQTGASVSSLIGELMGGVLALKVAGAEHKAMDRLRAANAQRGTTAVKASLFASLIEVCSVAAVELSTGLVLLLSADAMRRGEFTVGDLALFVAYLPGLTGLPRWTGRMLARHRQATVAIDRLARLLPGQPPEGVVAHRPVYLRTPPPPAPAPADAVPLERLDVKALSVRHPVSGRGVRDASFSVDAGTFVVVTGAVGAGKSTLLRGLLGLMDAEVGRVLWNGAPIAELSRFMVPPRVAYAAQVPRLFSATLRENLVLGWPADDDAVARALALAAFDDDALPEGLETVVGSRGVRLSGGQLQRATAARALVRQPELLVVDDLSSALDIETEHRLWERVASGTSTCLAVSHRRAALERADRVIVLQEGTVVATGPLDELLRTSAEMQRLWREELMVEAEEVGQ